MMSLHKVTGSIFVICILDPLVNYHIDYMALQNSHKKYVKIDQACCGKKGLWESLVGPCILSISSTLLINSIMNDLCSYRIVISLSKVGEESQMGVISSLKLCYS